MKDINIFQIVVLGGFLVLAVGAVLVFATFQAESNREDVPQLTIWGMLDAGPINQVLSDLDNTVGGLGNVTYVKIDPRVYYDQLVEALATGRGPDLIILDHTALVEHANKIIRIPFETIPVREYKAMFVEEAELLVTSEGLLGLPLRINPMVMYWNRDMFTSAGIAQPPRHWDEFFRIAPQLTRLGEDLKIRKSAIAFGEVRNVTHAKEILSLLMLQAGTPIVDWGRDGLVPVLTQNFGRAEQPAAAALRYYTEFSNPVKTVYSWNRSLRPSRNMFISGDLAVYFGFAGEWLTLQRMNPNLNLALAPVPQLRQTNRRLTYGHMRVLAIPRASRNPGAALRVARLLTSPRAQVLFANTTKLAPVRRDVLASKPTHEYWSVLYDSTLIAKGWLDPNYGRTYQVFQQMVESVTSGRENVSGAVREAEDAIEELL